MSPKPNSVSSTAKKPATKASTKKHYVLDTNVLLHDPTAIFCFQENDVYLPMVVLEEIDRHKKGVAETARNARQVTRSLDALLPYGSMAEGFSLEDLSQGTATGRLHFSQALSNKGQMLESEKADNLILAVAQELAAIHGPQAILVTKDINLRVKALAVGVSAQDYRNDRVLADEDVLPRGYLEVDNDFWDKNQIGVETGFWRKSNKQCARVTCILPVNSFVVENQSGKKVRLWRVESSDHTGSVLTQESLKSKSESLEPRNMGQTMALNLLFDQNIDIVDLMGQAGTGKTLLAVAAGLEQVRAGLFSEVLITRATVPMGEDIGFLPGGEQEKMDPWIGGTLRDVFSVLQLPEPGQNRSKSNFEAFDLRSKVEVASMSFMRGRTFLNKFLIIDEAQNLPASQMRALLTRAGEGCKVVLTGNLGQIDTPYLDEGTSGLSWAVNALQNWEHAGHLILARGERSRLASYIEDVASKEHNKG